MLNPLPYKIMVEPQLGVDVFLNPLVLIEHLCTVFGTTFLYGIKALTKINDWYVCDPPMITKTRFDALIK